MTDLKKKLLPPRIRMHHLTDQELFNNWYAQHFAPLFENAVEVYGYTDYDGDLSFSDREANADTHRALLIGVEPIERGVSVEEIVRVLRKSMSRDEFVELADRLEREGVKS